MTRQVTSPLTVLSDREITMTRVLDAPRELVYRAYTDPQIVPRWWGLRELTTVVERMEVRPDGTWRFLQKHPTAGTEYGFSGEYREVVPNELLVSTFGFDAMPELTMEDTTRFEDRDGKTRVTITSRFESAEQRDAMLETGLEGGANDIWDRLAEYLAATTSR